MPVEDFLATLNAHFERTAGAVQRHGGEIVSYIGDGVLAMFRAGDDLAEACARAVDAARDAVDEPDKVAPDFGVALHAGRVIHGNIGLPDRLQFTVIGAVVNEVVRVQDLTKDIGAPLLVTRALADRVPHSWHSHGAHPLRGVDAPVEVLAPSADHSPRFDGASGV
jgi:adenylate cyclase